MAEETINIIPLYEEVKNEPQPAPQLTLELDEKPKEKERFQEQETKTVSKKGKGIFKQVFSVISGNVLTKQEVVKHLPYLLFLALLALIYIANGFYAQEIVVKLNKANNGLKELRSEYISTKSDLMFNSKQSEVAKMSEKKIPGLKESLVPPTKIVVKP